MQRSDMTAAQESTIDRDAVDRLAERVVGPLDKGWPPATWGRTVEDVVTERLTLSSFPTPLMTLSRPALQHNIEGLASWTSAHGMSLAPHGKTTMAPQLWAAQLDAGAWGITVANVHQLAVARSFGVRRVLVANVVLSPLGLRWIANELAAHPDAAIATWADSLAVVAVMSEALAESASRKSHRLVDVLVELGGLGGRTGARSVDDAVAVARAVAASPYLRLAGVAGYEGALAHTTSRENLEAVRGYLREVGRLHGILAETELYAGPDAPVVSAGGSTYPDLVAEVLGPLGDAGAATVLLRAGAYIAHDDGYYREVSPWGATPRTDGQPLQAALHGWVRVSALPEPGLAIIDAGKRDLPFDEGLPEVQLLRPRTAGEAAMALTGFDVTALNDQHGFLRFDPTTTPLEVGDELRLGLSHPCTAFDKWDLIPVVDDPDAADPVVVDAIRTFF
jgi:D-serine deaminase-like pyridoxal phosphate-dependent protein